jgi:putative N6-adenine-specific DNA methylase
MQETLSYFVIVLPGLEDLALKEVELKCPVKQLKVVKGGLEVNADETWMIIAHTLLKIPTRILLRIGEFKVRDFPKLYQKFLKFNWNQYLSHPDAKFEVSCSKSRLNHTGKIEETIKSAIKEALIRQPLSQDWKRKNYSPQTFYVRLLEDTLTLSLDLSGGPLYKRGLHVLKGEAPLRETIAAALLLEIFQDLKDNVTLIDPMCGAGTFLHEALSFHQPLHKRKFAFEEAPFFKGKDVKLPPAIFPFPIDHAIGTDLNGDLLEKLVKENQIQHIDFIKADATSYKYPQNSLMICNPPYGERIKISGKKGHFLKNALEKFLEEDRPSRIGWLVPSDLNDLWTNINGYELLRKRSFRNGGLAVTFYIWKKI